MDEYLRYQTTKSEGPPTLLADPWKLVLIELFGGLSPLKAAFDRLVITPLICLYADTSRTATAVTRFRSPSTSAWPSIEELTPKKAHAMIAEFLPLADRDLTIVISCGAPCVDITRIKGGGATLSSEEGSKFEKGIAWIKEFKRRSLKHRWHVEFVIENVIPAESDLADKMHRIASTIPRTQITSGFNQPFIYALNPRDCSAPPRGFPAVSYNQPRIYWTSRQLDAYAGEVTAHTAGNETFGSQLAPRLRSSTTPRPPPKTSRTSRTSAARIGSSVCIPR